MTCTTIPSMTEPGTCPTPGQLATSVSRPPPSVPHLASTPIPLAYGGLAFTGADIVQIAVVGLIVVAVGILLLIGRRRTA